MDTPDFRWGVCSLVGVNYPALTLAVLAFEEGVLRATASLVEDKGKYS